jgi:2-amino-4-hydroxy-6-hydroxymethyldihydropteridine diphosphokinase
MILIALGANLPSPAGAPETTLRAALAELSQHQIASVAISPFYVTAAWPDPGDPDFVNAVAQIVTTLEPAQLLRVLQTVETLFGRRRDGPNAPRTLDLDILDYEGRIEAGPPELPHPRMGMRGFVLVPLADIAPHWRHPVSRRPVAELIAALPAPERELRKATG